MVAQLSRSQFLHATIAIAGTGLGLNACSGDDSSGNEAEDAAITPGSDARTTPGTDSATGADTSVIPMTDSSTNPDTSTPPGQCLTKGLTNAPIDDPKHNLCTITSTQPLKSTPLIIPPADITAGTTKDYHIAGTQLHDHTITLGPAEFALLKKNMKVTVTSTIVTFNNKSHSHMVDVICAS